MTVLAQDQPQEIRLGRVVAFLAGMATLALAITLLWLSMRVVMGIGGSCASGGPYVPAVECPDAVVALTPLSIFAGIFGVFLAAWGGAGLGGAWLSLTFLAWPALFLSLGWNFLEFGFAPPGMPGEVIWGWLFCGVVFVLMGGIPLLVGIWAARQGGASAMTGLAGRRAVTIPRGRYRVTMVDRRAAQADADAADVSRRLERLAGLHDDGDLTDAEFEAAKRATLDEAGAS